MVTNILIVVALASGPVAVLTVAVILGSGTTFGHEMCRTLTEWVDADQCW